MKSWIIGILSMCFIIAGGIFLSSGIAGHNNAPEGKGIGIPQTSIPNSPANPIHSLTIANFAGELAALLADEKLVDEKVSASALTCTIKDSGDYVIDLRLKNNGRETRTITIHPSGTKMDLLSNKMYRYDLHLAKEVSLINILVDDRTELQVQSPPCITAGWSGSGVSILTMLEQNPSQPTPPVPELSPLVLTLAGISGLLLLSRTRKN